MEVISFLNKLYGCFDDIIARHDAYKVETIGDAYMIASGIPDPNENHAIALADCALNIMLAVENFAIPHKPGRKLEVRIGIHSGNYFFRLFISSISLQYQCDSNQN